MVETVETLNKFIMKCGMRKDGGILEVILKALQSYRLNNSQYFQSPIMDMEQKRNYSYLPNLEREGIFIKSLPQPPEVDAKSWKDKLSPNNRVFFHQTLSSARHCAVFQELGNAPRDSLDMVLGSCYNHSDDLWHTKSETHTQPETLGQPTFRRLRNCVDSPSVKSQPLSHPLCIGGITERISTHSVKLIHSGPHTPLTNPGYSRQTSDGNFFNY